MTEIMAILMIFGMPVFLVFISKYFKYREKLLDVRRQQDLLAQGGDKKLLQASENERKQLESRIQNLESIVCSVDFELNQRLNRLAMENSRAMPAAQLATGGKKTPAAPKGGTLAEPARSGSMGQLTVGQTLVDRYKIVRELGHGGMGAVYLADDSKLGEQVALKTILSSLSGDPAEMADRFRREVQAARKVTHPHVIRIHDLGEDGQLLFLSMEYIEGETLFARGERLGALPVPDALDILRAVAEGVSAAHQVGIVHRDIKPQNVLLGGDNSGRTVKVIDFGLAQTSFARGLTATGIIMGTPEYMAPEQIRGARCDARTDVYALGALAYFTLCGRPPFTAGTPIAIGFAQVNDDATPPRQLRPEIPQTMEDAIRKAMNKDPADRFLDASEWRSALPE